MTDKEIIKALGSEKYMAYGGHGCVRCKYRYHKGEDRCGINGCKIARGALDIINRQQAEIEKLKAAADAELDTIHNLGDDYERVLEEEAQHIREAKIEAVKELGKKLIDNSYKGVISAADIFDIVYGYVKKGGDGE